MESVFEEISKSGVRPSLSVLKKHGDANDNWLSFPMKGFSLALDFPHHQKSRDLIHSLSKMVHSFDGRFYMTKDSLLNDKELFSNYPKSSLFLSFLKKNKFFMSDQMKRWFLS